MSKYAPVVLVQFSVYVVMSPFCMSSAGGSQDNVRTVLSVTVSTKFCGGPLGAGENTEARIPATSSFHIAIPASRVVNVKNPVLLGETLFSEVTAK